MERGTTDPVPWLTASYLLATAPAGSFVRGQLLLHAGRALHFLGVKGHAAERAERRGHLKTRLQTLPAEPGATGRRRQGREGRSAHTGAAPSPHIHFTVAPTGPILQ